MLVTGASDEVASRLLDVAGLDFAPVQDRDYEARIAVVSPPSGPLEREKIAASVRLDAIMNAPGRFNVVSRGSADATAAIIRFLAKAHAVTGQFLAAAQRERPNL